MWRRLIFVPLLLLLLVGCDEVQGKDYHAQRFDVDVVVAEDGSLRVTETVVFEFVGGPFSFVFRELETDLTDGIVDIEARVDGNLMPRGEQAGQVEIDGNDPIRVEWHLEPFRNMTRTFELSYRVLGVVRQSEGADLLVYQPLPDEYEYRIDSSTTVIDYPPTAQISGEVQVTTENGVVQRFDDQVMVTAQNLGPDETLVVQAPFAAGSLIDAPPAWQQRRLAQRETGPWWIAAAVGVFVVGLAGLAVIYRRHKPQPARPPHVVMEPPSKLPPALAGVINGSGAQPAWSNALATLFDLAEQGVLQFEELAEKPRFKKHDFVIRRISQPADLRPHEQGLLAALFDGEDGPADELKLSDLSKRMSAKGWKRFSEPLKAEVKAAGFFSPERQQVRSRLTLMGIVLMVAGFGFFIAAAIAENGWMVAFAGSLALLGVIAATSGSNLRPLSDAGATAAAEWQRFADYLKDVSKGKAAVSGPSMFEKFLPYAASYGLLEQWANWFKKEGWTDPPGYFRSLSTNDGMHTSTFLAMIAATNASGGSAAGAAGAAGAGAAGGGASGAG